MSQAEEYLIKPLPPKDDDFRAIAVKGKIRHRPETAVLGD
jgi:hypothetical protein